MFRTTEERKTKETNNDLKLMKTHVGDLKRGFSRRGIFSYSLELSHNGLKKHKVIHGPSPAFVQEKAGLLAKEWDTRWIEILEAWDLEETALIRSKEAKKALDLLKNIISPVLNDYSDIFEKLKDLTPFPKAPPVLSAFPPKPIPKPIPYPPVRKELPIHKIDALIDLIPWLRRKAIADYEKKVAIQADRFKEEYSAWEKTKLHVEEQNRIKQNEYNLILEKIDNNHKRKLNIWEIRKNEYFENQQKNNEKFDLLKESYLGLDPEAIHDFFVLILECSEYPDCLNNQFKVEYLSEIKTILIDYSLPSPETIPTLKEVRYVKSRNELIERHISQAEHEKLYDNLLYQIALRTIYEVLKADIAEAVEAVIFNGWVRSIDRSTGKEINPCVMSLQCKRSDFLSLNLANIDPKSCFKFLKGIGSSKLFQLAAIAPILQSQQTDKRFVQSYAVVDTLEDSYNLATMDWEDFEHLIRELFEKEFVNKGCEVKVTRASRDGGVDAIIFDPDPIHGGKIVIQAKRYTNPVGVSAVRDLYGTVLNEGANKGILVTTSDFGPDSYSFANGKPIVLFNGGNLLMLLEKHGHKAKIDLKEIKF